MTRSECRMVQAVLKEARLYPGSIDGIPGPMTLSALRVWQRQHGLVDDGLFGPKTRAAMFKPEEVVLSPPSNGPFYVGAAKRLEPGDIDRVASEAKIEIPAFKAIVAVESAGSGFSGNRVLALYEPHIAYRMSSGRVRRDLVMAGIAYQKWGTRKYPRRMDERYEQIDRCEEIGGAELAADCSSWGLPQICGFNANAAGYMNAVDMVMAFAADEENQIAAMAAFILNNSSIHKALARHDWETVAELYNGAAYRKHNYHGRLKSAYKSFT